MNNKRKYLFWLIPAALVLLAVLFFLYPRRVDVILHMPASAADIRDVNFSGSNRSMRRWSMSVRTTP